MSNPITEWWYGNRPLTDEETAHAEAYAASRGHAPDEHHITRPVIRQAPAPLGTPARRRSGLTTVVCVHCGDRFGAGNSQRRFCSRECQKAAAKARRAA